MRPLLALFLRSMREHTRHKLTPFARAGLVLAILLPMMAYQRIFTLIGVNAPGREFFSMVITVNIFFLVLAAFSTFCSVITEEKEEETLGLLRMTNLNPLAILLGKSTSRLCGVLLLLAAQFPFTLLAVALGGVSLVQIFAAYAVLVSSMFFLCNLALVFSVICRRTRKATGCTFATAFVLYVWVIPDEWHPLTEFYSKVMGSTFTGPVLGAQFWSHLIGGVLFFLAAWALFERFCSESAETGTRKAVARVGVVRVRQFTVGRPGRLALAWKDFHFMTGGKKGVVVRFFIYTFLILGFTALSEVNSYSGVSARTVGAMLMFWSLVCAAGEIIGMCVRMFGHEQKWQTLSSLITLPLTTGQIFRQKILGGLPVLLVPLGIFILGAMLDPDDLVSFFHELWGDAAIFLSYALVQALLFLLLLMNFSLRFRRAALIAAVGVTFIVNFIFGVGSMFMIRTSADGRALMGFGTVVFTFVAAGVLRDLFRLIPKAAAAE